MMGKDLSLNFVQTGVAASRPRTRDVACCNHVKTLGAAALIAGSVFASSGALLAKSSVLSFDHDQTLGGADFQGRKDLVGAIFTKANCQKANFTKANLTNANIEDANFSDADFTSADLTNVFAPHAKFARAKLVDVDLSNAFLLGAKLDGADVTGADFTDAMLDPITELRLCYKAKGTNSKTGNKTFDTLACEELTEELTAGSR